MHRLLALPLLAACGPEDVASDGIPDRHTDGPGGWSAQVSDGGHLRLAGPDGVDMALPGPAQPEVAFSPDGRRFAYTRGRGDTALVVLPVPPDGSERVVADWGVSADLPSFSPDGHHLAFVSGRTGIASIWMVDLDLPNPGAAAVQITNVGLEKVHHEPGVAPAGFVPPPMDTITWVATADGWTVKAP